MAELQEQESKDLKSVMDLLEISFLKGVFNLKLNVSGLISFAVEKSKTKIDDGIWATASSFVNGLSTNIGRFLTFEHGLLILEVPLLSVLFKEKKAESEVTSQ